jgi:hypothetical protein
MLTAALTTLALAAAVAASPAPSSQNGAPGCVGLANGVGNVKKFTLEAYIDGTQKTTPLALVRMTPSLLLSFIVVRVIELPSRLLRRASRSASVCLS